MPIILAIVASLSAFLLGVALVDDPSLTLPLTLQVVFLGLLTLIPIRVERDAGVRRGLLLLVALALLARLGALLVVHFVLDPSFFAIDSEGYAELGRRLSLHWRNLGENPVRSGGWQIGYPLINGFFFWLYGRGEMGAVVLNVFMGVWTSLASFFLARRVLGRRAAWIAGVLTALFPSLVLWSVLNLRDAPTTFLTTLIVLLGVRAYQSNRPLDLFLALGALIVLSTLRDYMAFLVAGGLTVGIIAALRRGRIGIALVSGLVLLLAATFVAESVGILSKAADGELLQTATGIREGMRSGAGSAFGSGYDTSSPVGAMRYLPVGLAYILLAPFPWKVSSLLQLATLPEVMIWYAIIPFFLVGLIDAFRNGSRANLLVLSALGAVLVSYALVEGNVGTAYRHRAQIMPLALVYAAAGMERAWRAMRARRGRRRRNPAAFREAG